jgi:hypothetical protein
MKADEEELERLENDLRARLAKLEIAEVGERGVHPLWYFAVISLAIIMVGVLYLMWE